MGTVDEEIKGHSLSTPDIKSDPQPSTSGLGPRMNFTNSTYEYVAFTCGRVMIHSEGRPSGENWLIPLVTLSC